MALQLMGCTAPPVTRRTGELLPHLFTLTRFTGGSFLFHLPYPHGYLPVRKHDALRCPDFPPPVMDGKRWNGLLFYVKDTKKYAIGKIFFPVSDWFVPHTPEP